MKKNPLKSNVFFSYISQVYLIISGLIVMPYYMLLMGSEAYGLIGIFSLMQTAFVLLDFGLTPTIARETARFKVGAHSEEFYSKLYSVIFYIFLFVAIIGAALLFLLSPLIAKHWLNLNGLSVSEVTFCLYLMSISVALRWLNGLDRGVISGSENIVWLSNVNMIIATLKFFGVFLFLYLFGYTATNFFTYQLIIALIEFFTLKYKSIKLRPCLKQKLDLLKSLPEVKKYIGFSLSIALTSGLWVIATQTDKIIVSKIVTLEEYGYFTLAILIASGIMMVATPLSGPIMPRLTKLYAENNSKDFINLYSKATKLTSMTAGTLSVFLYFFSERILFVWTGNNEITSITAPILSLYAAGYGFLALSAFFYYMQYAIGDLKLHVLAMVTFMLITIPSMAIVTNYYGMFGTGFAWLIINIIHFLTWSFIVHNKFFPGFHLEWLVKDIFQVLFPVFITTFILSFFGLGESRFEILIYLVSSFLLVFVSPALFIKEVRSFAFKHINYKFKVH